MLVGSGTTEPLSWTRTVSIPLYVMSSEAAALSAVPLYSTNYGLKMIKFARCEGVSTPRPGIRCVVVDIQSSGTLATAKEISNLHAHD